MAQSQQVKVSFKAPEGRYVLHNERGSSCTFVPTRPLRLTFGVVQHLGTAHNYIIYNILDTLAFCHYSAIDKHPVRQILVGSGSTGQLIYPTCHDHHPSPDNLDLVVGLNTGDVVIGSVKAQLQASGTNVKLLDLLHFNPEGAIDTTRAMGVAWIPGTNASLFAGAHQSGNIYLYQPQTAIANATDSSPRNGKSAVPRPSLTIQVCNGGLTSMAVSPDGVHVASTTKDGVLYVHDLNTGALLRGFKAHYGGLTCCAWSHDSHYIATGGEDDLVCVYGTAEQAVVFWGEGHTSWITKVAFDRWESETSSSERTSQSASTAQQTPEQTRYRIASVGQDCQLLLWDFAVEEGEYKDSLDLSPPSTLLERQETYPGAVHRRTPSNPHANGGHVSSNGLGGSDQRIARGQNPLPSEISPPVKRSEMLFSTPVMAQTIHGEPCSDIIFMREAVYTGGFCGQIRCWRRPERLSAESRQTSLEPVSRQSSTVNE